MTHTAIFEELPAQLKMACLDAYHPVRQGGAELVGQTPSFVICCPEESSTAKTSGMMPSLMKSNNRGSDVSPVHPWRITFHNKIRLHLYASHTLMSNNTADYGFGATLIIL
jgi:hypothetical protein